MYKNDEEKVPDYVLIQLGEETLKLPKTVENKRYSGVIKECQIETITPIFIGSDVKKQEKIKTRNGQIKAHNKEKFLYDAKNKKYMIPSSSLKGMIRNICDMVTNSVIVESKINLKDEIYKDKPHDFIKKEFHPTNENNNLSISEEMFGATMNSVVNNKAGEKFKNSKGKIYFTDAKLDEKKAKLEKDFLLNPLHSPRKVKFEYKNNNKYITGRKYYRHNLNIAKNNLRSKNKNAQNTTIELMEKGNKFIFDVYFENLSYFEMGLLMYLLKLEDKMYHKIGRGKPLGMGSCKIELGKLYLDREREEKYKTFSYKKKLVNKEAMLIKLSEKFKLKSNSRENMKELEKVLKGKI
ncbi:RAMP superfamily CRISPR-associated protein [Leptotrichia trevisanii]|uniref:RAMP superfamily CRISPR-associated protein n=1 Tax=Leptotrichia trevisanii TaxID=109328 RepID=UPI0026F13FAB|nr:RAMP superfamily CRISPR-associated protein [Leptotrichia trevisanii]